MIPTTELSRRTLLQAGLAASLTTGASPLLATSGQEETQKSLCILGGTGFLGPKVVEAAKAVGYKVTLFNRGKTNPGLFPELEKLRGDRNSGDLSALEGRAFDVVVDTSGYVPGHVRSTAEILGPRCNIYVFVSTISVYQSDGEGTRGEDWPTIPLTEEVLEKAKTIREAYANYGGMKAYCEKAAEEVLPERALVIRPGLIVGPGDPTDRFTYWPVRIARGGKVLAPGDPKAIQQPIDVRDLAEWIVRAADAKTTGRYNALGYRGRVNTEELLHACKLALNTETEFTWVPDDFLRTQDIRPWLGLPLWIPGGGKHYSNRAAIEAGLTFRPVTDTISATEEWHRTTRGDAHTWRAGPTLEREAEVLEAWRKSQGLGEDL